MLGNKIQKWLKKQSVSKAQLARGIGRSRSYVTRLERGDIQPSAEALFRVAVFFKRRVEDVFQLVAENKLAASFSGSKVLPVGQHMICTPAAAKLSCNQPATPPARPAVPVVIKDKSLVNPTAKAVASPVAQSSQRKNK